VIESEVVTAIRDSTNRGWGRKTTARRLMDARVFFAGRAEGDAVVVWRLLAEQGIAVGARTVQRGRGPATGATRADLSTVRVDTAGGDPLQLDLGPKRFLIGGTGGRSFCWSRR
jgi:hypothetical protein